MCNLDTHLRRGIWYKFGLISFCTSHVEPIVCNYGHLVKLFIGCQAGVEDVWGGTGVYAGARWKAVEVLSKKGDG